MFDLEQSISEWRQQMLAAGIQTPVPLEELEIHLREEIERQMRSGTNEQRAFEVAVQQIGKANMLKTEFKKAGMTKEDRGWRLIQIIFPVISTLIPLLMICMALFKTRLELTSSQQMSSLAAAATFSLLAWSGRLGYEIFPIVRVKRIREAIHVSGGVLVVLWWIVFSHMILPRYDFIWSQLFVTVNWAILPSAGTLVGLIWGLETAARKKMAMVSS